MKLTFAVALLIAFSSHAFAADSCSVIFTETKGTSVDAKGLKAQSKAQYQAPNVDAYNKLRAFIAAHPALKTEPKFVKSLVAVLRDEQLSTFHSRVSRVVDALVATPADATREQVLASVEQALAADLRKELPATLATERAALVRDTSLTKEKMLLALGRLSATESLKALVGTDPRQIEPGSIVDQYLAGARAAGKNVQVLVDSFSMGPGYEGRGGEKLFVAVDQSTAALANQLFGNNSQILAHDHSVSQGTLQMHFLDRAISYAQYNQQYQLQYQQSKIVPLIVLSSIEGANANNYFTLGSLDQKMSKLPWGLRNSANPNETSYCKVGGYGSCTHWIGEMAIGEKHVTTYQVPRFVGDDPYGSRPPGMEDGEFQVRSVGTYDSFAVPGRAATPIDSVTRVNRLTRIVWTQGAGHEQLWSMVGDHGATALNNGEWANPGWVVYSFMTKTSYERVPVVLVYVPDASQPLTRATLDGLKSSIHAR